MVGLLPSVFWALNWLDYDSLLFNHYYKQQQAQAGHRAVALQMYNAVGSFSKGFQPLREAEFWPLSLLDPAPKPKPQIDWARHEFLAARSGKKFPTAQA